MAAEQNVRHEIIPKKIKAAIFAVGEADDPVTYARPLHTTPRLGGTANI